MVARGTYPELQRSGLDFTSLLKHEEEEELQGAEPRIRTLSQTSMRSQASSIASLRDGPDQQQVGSPGPAPSLPVQTFQARTASCAASCRDFLLSCYVISETVLLSKIALFCCTP